MVVNIKSKVGNIQRDLQVQVDISASGERFAGNWARNEGVQGGLHERIRASGVGRRLGIWSTNIAQDRRIDPTRKACRQSKIGVRTNPVVADFLVCIDHDGITLSGEYLEGVNGKRLVVDTVDLDDCHAVAVDAEDKIGVAADCDESEPITKSLGNTDNREC